MLVIGSTFLDVKGFSADRYVPEERNIGDVQMMVGGVCCNVAENLAQLGVPSKFVSMVDDNAQGREIREQLGAIGVDVSDVVESPRGMGVWMVILDEHGDVRGQISHQPNFAALHEYLIKHGDRLVEACDSIVLEFDMIAPIAELVLGLAQRYQKKVYSIVGNMGVILRHPEYLRHVACFICNEMEAGRLFKRDLTAVSPEDMLTLLLQESRDKGIRSMVITMGSSGAVYVDHATGEFGRCPAVPTGMVDSTGAGDAFFSGTVAALQKGLSLDRAVRIGTTLASRTLAVESSCCPDSRDLFE